MSQYSAKADHLSEILNLYPDQERWCAGYAPSQGRRCHNPISGAHRGSAVRLLDEGSERMRQGEDIDDLLMDLASLVLCRHVHQKDPRSQVPTLVKKWQEKIRGVSEDLEKGEGVIGRSVWRYHHSLFTACSIDHGAAWAIHCSCTDPSCFYLILTFKLSIFRLFAIKACTSTSFNLKPFPHYLPPDGQPPCYCYSSFQLSRLSDFFDVGVYISFYVNCKFHHLTYKRQSKSKSCYHLWLWTYRNGFLSRASFFAAGISSASRSDTTTTTSVTSTRTITVSTSSSTSTAAPTTSTASPRVSVSSVEPEASASGPTDAPARSRTASTTVTPAASTSAPTNLASTSTTTATAGASSTSSPTFAPTAAPTVPAQTATATATATPESTTTTSQPDTSSPAVISQPPRSSSSSSSLISSTAAAVSVPSPLVPKPTYTPTRQPITGDCSICYEPLLPGSPFTTPHQAARDLSIVYCKQQCGTNFHFSCMFTWKKTASQRDREPTCPMCRAAWS
ncbi:hypothetical protein BO99DRAFT_444219 [Aspergillus violaceofuscus CBS 115571]|uniref:RING-type domain-containing protein n=1 Tax=Aspergillus violaceofuscus (strain CBS 115571) TaxID=1450538 RepID=A0A2V5HA97_ASPV1|nr:hypothetical protein BO99DRAFT_444219 [Aspergillus violaceofuscus CBS 115571]